MVLHGLAHDVGHLVVAAVVDRLHGVEDAPLHGLQAILDMGHGTLQDHVGGVIQKPVLVHARELAHAPLVLRQAVVLARTGPCGGRHGGLSGLFSGVGIGGGSSGGLFGGFGCAVVRRAGGRSLRAELLVAFDLIFFF